MRQTKNSADDIAFGRHLVEILKEIETLRVGMTRAELLKSFSVPGGFSVFSRTKQTYEFKKCPMVKITVEFMPIGPITNRTGRTGESERDRIVSISPPFLGWVAVD